MSSSSKINIFNPFLVVTLDMTTYNCPCVITGRGKYNPTLDNDWPWLFFIDKYFVPIKVANTYGIN